VGRRKSQDASDETNVQGATPEGLAALREASRQVRPTGFLDYKVYLDSLYYQTKIAVKPYSYRKFAADLGFNATTVIHQIVNGYRPLTRKSAERIADAAALADGERAYLVKLVDYVNAAKDDAADERGALFEELVRLKAQAAPASSDKDWLEFCSAWYHTVVREMVALPDFREDPAWIAARIEPRVTPAEVAASLALLERLQMIRYDRATGRYEQCNARISTGHDVRGLGLVRFHQEMIDHGREALLRVPGAKRHVSAVTFRCSSAALETLKAMISDFHTRLLDVAENGPGDEVFQMNFQLFPFTGKGGGAA
jgi:uncharacterized protein (TIGR02147 family)